jgi:hypothetical protein
MSQHWLARHKVVVILIIAVVSMMLVQTKVARASCGANSISLTSPQSGIVARGRGAAITWTTLGLVGSSLRIDLYSKGSLFQNIATGVPTASHSYNWSVSSGEQLGSGYSIHISDGNGHGDQSRSFLIIR